MRRSVRGTVACMGGVFYRPAVATREPSGWVIDEGGIQQSAFAAAAQCHGWLLTPGNVEHGITMILERDDARVVRAWLPFADHHRAYGHGAMRALARDCALSLSAAVGAPVRIVPVAHTAGRLRSSEVAEQLTRALV